MEPGTPAPGSRTGDGASWNQGLQLQGLKNRSRSLLEPATPAPGSQEPETEPPVAGDSSSRAGSQEPETEPPGAGDSSSRVSRTGDEASWSRGLQLQGLKARRRSLLEPVTLVTGSPQTEPPLKWPALQHIDCYAGTSLPLEC